VTIWPLMTFPSFVKKIRLAAGAAPVVMGVAAGDGVVGVTKPTPAGFAMVRTSENVPSGF
jgi:hypothetical protein